MFRDRKINLDLLPGLPDSKCENLNRVIRLYIIFKNFKNSEFGKLSSLLHDRIYFLGLDCFYSFLYLFSCKI